MSPKSGIKVVVYTLFSLKLVLQNFRLGWFQPDIADSQVFECIYIAFTVFKPSPHCRVFGFSWENFYSSCHIVMPIY